MTPKIETRAIIKIIEEQSNVIVEKITNNQVFERWIKQQINTELQRINNEFLSDNFKFLAIIIDAIYQFLKNKSDEDKTNLIENCLTNLINKWSNLSEKEIKEIGYHLKVYTKTNDSDARIALEEFIGKSGGFISLFRDISTKLVSSCEKSLSNLSNTIKTEFNAPFAVELASKLSLPNQIPGIKNTTFEQPIDRPAKYKKKIKPRVIAFDTNGKGYVVNERKRVRKKNFSLDEVKNKKSIENFKTDFSYENESQFTKDIREAYFFRNILKKSEINYNHEKSIESIFQSFSLEEFKSDICKRLYDFKIQNPKIFFNGYKKDNICLLPNFSDTQSEYQDNFLLLINFSNLKQLAKKSDIIAYNINTLMPILEDIIQFYTEWNVNQEFCEFFEIKNNFHTKLNNNIFVCYLEKVICLIEENKLKLDKVSLDFNYEVSNLTLKNVSEDSKIKINELKSVLSIDLFLKEQQEAIQRYFNKNFPTNLDNIQTNPNFSVFKLFLVKIYLLILNVFNISFFINNVSNLSFFSSKLEKLNLELNQISLDIIYNELILKWNCLEFIKNGINPFFFASTTFKKKLSEKIFLHIVNHKFLHFNSHMDSFPNDKNKLANDLLLIQLCLEKAKIGTVADLVSSFTKYNFNSQKIGVQIIKLLNENEAFKEYLNALVTLGQNIQALNEEFSLVYNATQNNILKSREPQKNDCFSRYVSKGNCLFKLPQASQIPNFSPIMHKI